MFNSVPPEIRSFPAADCCYPLASFSGPPRKKRLINGYIEPGKIRDISYSSFWSEYFIQFSEKNQSSLEPGG